MVGHAGNKPRLYNHPLSFACQIARLCLVEKGVAWREFRVDIGPGLETDDPWFVALTPAMELPVLRHGERVVVGAEAVCRYVDGAFDGPLLDHRGEAQPWIDLVQRLPVALLTAAHYPGFFRRDLQRRLRRLEERAAANPQLAGLYADKAAEVDLSARDLASPDRIAAAERQLEVTLDRAEAALAHQPFLTGDHFTLADVFWAALLSRLTLLGHDRLWTGGGRPGVAAYRTRLQARPSLAKAGLLSALSPGALAPVALRSYWSPLLRFALAAALAAIGIWLWQAFL